MRLTNFLNWNAKNAGCCTTLSWTAHGVIIRQVTQRHTQLQLFARSMTRYGGSGRLDSQRYRLWSLKSLQPRQSQLRNHQITEINNEATKLCRIAPSPQVPLCLSERQSASSLPRTTKCACLCCLPVRYGNLPPIAVRCSESPFWSGLGGRNGRTSPVRWRHRRLREFNLTMRHRLRIIQWQRHLPLGFCNPRKEWITTCNSPPMATAEVFLVDPAGGSTAVRHCLTRFSTSSHCGTDTTRWLVLRLRASTASNHRVRSYSDDNRNVYCWPVFELEPFGLWMNLSGRFGESSNSLASSKANFLRCLSDPATDLSIWVLTAAACDLLAMKMN